MRTNQRPSRRTAHRSHPVLVAFGLGLAILVGGGVGKKLDLRYRAAAVDNAGVDEVRASLRPGNLAEVDHQNAIRTAVEQRSGVIGLPIFMPERWTAAAPVVVDGVDVSNLLVQDFQLKRSEIGGYSFKRLKLDATLDRPGTFFEFTFGDGKNGSAGARISKDQVAIIFRSTSGQFVEVARAEADRLQRCGVIEVELAGESLIARCGTHEVVKASGLNFGQGRILASTNLVRSEVRALTLVGRVGEAEIEDGL